MNYRNLVFFLVLLALPALSFAQEQFASIEVSPIDFSDAEVAPPEIIDAQLVQIVRHPDGSEEIFNADSVRSTEDAGTELIHLLGATWSTPQGWAVSYGLAFGQRRGAFLLEAEASQGALSVGLGNADVGDVAYGVFEGWKVSALRNHSNRNSLPGDLSSGSIYLGAERFYSVMLGRLNAGVYARVYDGSGDSTPVFVRLGLGVGLGLGGTP